jgi:hypothetical protein
LIENNFGEVDLAHRLNLNNDVPVYKGVDPTTETLIVDKVRQLATKLGSKSSAIR